MNWNRQIDLFQPLTFDDVILFAPPGEMNQALANYNKAIFNLRHDAADVAMIALRKLASSYPMFPHPAALLGLCLARDGQEEAALDQLDKAMLSALPDDLQEAAQECRNDLIREETEGFESAESSGRLAHWGIVGRGSGSPAVPRAGTAVRAAGSSAAPRAGAAGGLPRGPLVASRGEPTGSRGSGEPAGSAYRAAPIAVQASGFLERAGKPKRLMIASERERQEILRGGDYGAPKETRVLLDQSPSNRLRRFLVWGAVALLVLSIAAAGIFWLPGYLRGGQTRVPATAEERLDWLIERMNRAVTEDSDDLAGILEEYRQRFTVAEANPS